MTVNNIIKLAIKRLEKEGKLLTPDFYAEAFCLEAKKAGVKFEDCEHVQNMIKNMPPDLQKEIKNYRIQTISELSRFLIAKISRLNKNRCEEILDKNEELLVETFESIKLLHNLEAKELAIKSIEMIKQKPTLSQIEHFRQLWENFRVKYDDTFLKKLEPFTKGKVFKDDLKKSLSYLEKADNYIQNNGSLDFDKISSLLVYALTPSISSTPQKNIIELSERLKQNPQIIFEDDIYEQIKSTIALRISLDKQSVKAMIKSLEGVLDRLSNRLLKMMEDSDVSANEIKKIKDELDELKNKEKEIDFKITHNKLYTIASALELNTKNFRVSLDDHSKEVEKLQKRVKELEEELRKTKEEAKTDFLTKLYNKRGLDEMLKLKEGEFERFGKDFSIVMFDIDYFKKVNDTYGHEAGDAVLKGFAKILISLSRDIDIIGRYGGEEFMAILTNTDLDGAYTFATKVNKKVKKSNFLYKNQSIKITVSGGIAQRSKAISLKNTIDIADKNLYKAKNSGRDRIEKN